MVGSSMAALESNEILLDVKDLQVHFDVRRGTVRALEGVNFTVRRGSTMGIIGESGSGKSVTARAIMHLLAKNGRIVNGEILYYREAPEGNLASSEVIDISQQKANGPLMRSVRGGEIAMIFQEPMSSLTPVYTAGLHIGESIQLHLKPRQPVGDQMAKAIARQNKIPKNEARQIAVEMLDRVGIPRASERVDSYPHELSGGQRQRVMIAIALSCGPKLLIADEPTTALDVTTQAQINDLMLELKDEFGMAIMYITHDLGVIAEMAEDIAVMYLGRIVEQGKTESIFYDPQHPYTKALLKSIPRIGGPAGRRLVVIEGMVPDPFHIPTGCPFHDRCPEVVPGLCNMYEPVLLDTGPEHRAACLLHDAEKVGEVNRVLGHR